MRDLRLSELNHVYGAGGSGCGSSPQPPSSCSRKGSKGKHSKSKGSKGKGKGSRSKGSRSKGSRCY